MNKRMGDTVSDVRGIADSLAFLQPATAKAKSATAAVRMLEFIGRNMVTPTH